MRISFLTLLPLITALGACSGIGANETLVVGRPKSASFQSDLAECRRLARQQGQLDAETGAAVVLGAGLPADQCTATQMEMI